MSGRRRLTSDERALWTTFTQKIARLRKHAPADDADADPEEAVSPAPLRRVKAPPISAKKAEPKPPARKEPPLSPLNRREKQRIARGRDAVDARIDLHGHTQAQAHTALRRFLHRAHGDDARVVLVITGKSGVLRQQVPQWLGLPEFRALVVGFDVAALRHGGEGALYVRVRRARAERD